MKIPGRDVPLKKFLIKLKDEYKKDRVQDAAGSLTFFGVLAMFPFLLFLVALASVIIQPAQAQALIDQLSQVAPPAVTQILGERLKTLAQDQSVGLLSIGALGALWSASSGVVAVMRALNTAYDVEEGRGFFKTRGIALGFVLFGGALGVAAAAAMVATPALANAVGGQVGTVINWLRLPVAGLIALFVWALAYYVLPDVKQKFQFITPGSVIGVVIWLVASWGFSFYVQNFGNYDATYGTLGGVIILLIWMWLSAQVLLLGAEINSIIEHWSPDGKNEGEKVPPGEQGSGRLPGDDSAEGRGKAWAHAAEGKPAAAKLGVQGADGGMQRSRGPGIQELDRAHRRAGSSKARSVGMALWGAVTAAALFRLRRPT